ncbi:hypothetical protein WL283_09770 [Staphylococcus epidermidis]|uniref:hypothetical protein n=1 Tax=Staphylococcus epidermidis TaxID=1282 RepID=UPI0030C29376
MTSKYTIYHDEAFHDHKVTAKQNSHLNIENKDSSSYFYLMHIGFKTERLDHYIDSYIEIEKNYKDRLKLANEQELKGTTFKKKWFQYGIKSMNDEQIEFYENFLKILDKDVLISVSIINKFELVFNKVFDNSLRALANHDEIKKINYVFSKFIYMNKTERLLNLMFDTKANQSAIRSELKNIANNVIKRNKSIPHKFTETPIAYELLEFIKIDEKIYNSRAYDMNYGWAFAGLHLLLKELRIPENTCNLYIDGEEGFEDTTQMLQKDFYNVQGVNSKESTGTRLTDMFIRIISAIIHSLEDQLINIGKSNKEEKHDLSKKWFEISEKQFNLYITIANIFNQRANIEWVTHLSVFTDAAYIFFRLLDYVSYFKSFTDFKKINSDKHASQFMGYSLTSYDKYLNEK